MSSSVQDTNNSAGNDFTGEKEAAHEAVKGLLLAEQEIKLT